MCTAATYLSQDFYFGRTLDYERSYGEKVVIIPRNYPFSFRQVGTISHHYAIIGMVHMENGFPLFYDGMNEKGLCMAGLNFVGNAVYREPTVEKDNIAQFEFIPWILSQCSSVKDAKDILQKVNITPEAFSEKLPASQLHWMISDQNETIVVESVQEGLMIYDNPAGVLTNNPPFPLQMFNLQNYMYLSPSSPHNHFSNQLDLKTYSRGMGAMGLPGDLSSQSRFVRVAFTKLNSCSDPSEVSSVSQFFHILGSVSQQRGCCKLESGAYEITLYTSCCNAQKGIYYYTTYNNSQITAINLHHGMLDSTTIQEFSLVTTPHILWQN